MITYIRSHRLGHGGVLGAAGATVVLHAILLTTPLQSDEGGYAVVAQHAHEAGPYIYGHLFVDRPPLLIEIFRLANTLGSYGSRILALVVAVLLVLATARAAYLIAGSHAAVWAAWIAAALGSSGLLAAEQLNGEILAAAFVAVAIAAFLEAVHVGSERRCLGLLLAVGSGAASLGALLVKQNFADALAFVAVYLLVHLLRRTRGLGAVWGGYAIGLLTVAAWVAIWARSHHGIGALAYAMYGIRLDASHALAKVSFSGELRLLGIFAAAALASGILILAATLVVTSWREALRLTPLRLAYAGAVLVELIGIFGGGNFAPHYLLGLIPTQAAIAGVVIARLRGTGAARRSLRWATGFTLASCLIAAPTMAVIGHVKTDPDATIAAWVKKASSPGDTIVVPFTNAQVIRLSGLTPDYPYMWALLVRTRDPHLALFLKTLNGPTPPTWIVQWDSPADLEITPSGSIDAALSAHYQRIGSLCGHPVWLLDGHHARAAFPQSCK